MTYKLLAAAPLASKGSIYKEIRKGRKIANNHTQTFKVYKYNSLKPSKDLLEASL